MTTTTPHDALFKAIFSRTEHAAAALRSMLPPAIAARIDFRTLALRPGSFVDQKLAGNHSDLLFSATMAGRPVLIYLLFEHQSSSDGLMAFRLLRYMLRIWEDHLAGHPAARRLPAILPMVLHHSEAGWRAAVRFEELLDLDLDSLDALGDYIPRFRFVLDDVSFEPDEALRARAMSALGRLVLWCFRHARQPEELLERMAGWRDVAREVRAAPDGGAALALVWRYILTITNPRRPEELLRRLVEAAGPEAEEEIVSVADYLEERGRLKGLDEGRLKGLDEGRLEGRLEGQRSTLLKLLAVRFGALPEAVVHRIQEAEAGQIDGWLERVVTASTLGEVLGEG